MKGSTHSPTASTNLTTCSNRFQGGSPFAQFPFADIRIRPLTYRLLPEKQLRIRNDRAPRQILDARYVNEYRIRLGGGSCAQSDLQHTRKKKRIVRLCRRACQRDQCFAGWPCG